MLYPASVKYSFLVDKYLSQFKNPVFRKFWYYIDKALYSVSSLKGTVGVN